MTNGVAFGQGEVGKSLTGKKSRPQPKCRKKETCARMQQKKIDW